MRSNVETGRRSGSGGYPPLLLHIPHASLVVPHAIRRQLVLTDAGLKRELLRMTDRYTDELFDLSPRQAVSVVYPVSRLVVDPERFEDDAQEPMAVRGMGAVYVLTSDQIPLRNWPTLAERRQLINRYYRPHHRQLQDAVARCLRLHRWCLILDAHSFPSSPLPYEPDQAPRRPDYCVGSDPFHTPPWLTRGLIALLRQGGRSVKHNRPYGGTIVPSRHYLQDRRVLSVMIEVNRKLYMNEASGQKRRGFSAVHRHLQAVIHGLVELVESRLLNAS